MSLARFLTLAFNHGNFLHQSDSCDNIDFKKKNIQFSSVLNLMSSVTGYAKGLCVCPQDGGAPVLEKRNKPVLHVLVYSPRSTCLQRSWRTALHAP